jgi:hypothetical protein
VQARNDQQVRARSDQIFYEALNPSIVRHDILRDNEENFSFSPQGDNKKKSVKFDLDDDMSEDTDSDFFVASDAEISAASYEDELMNKEDRSTGSSESNDDSTQESDDSSQAAERKNLQNTILNQDFYDSQTVRPNEGRKSFSNHQLVEMSEKRRQISLRQLGKPRDPDDFEDADDFDEQMIQKKGSLLPPKKIFCSAKKLLNEEQKDSKARNDNTSKKLHALADEGISEDIDLACEKVETNISTLTESIESNTLRLQEEQLEVVNCIKELVENDALVVIVPSFLEAVAQNRLLAEKIEKFQ